jgi:site-specific recombinase XerD
MLPAVRQPPLVRSACVGELFKFAGTIWLLRHYFGSLLVERGADAATVRDLMEHSSL